MKRTVRMICTWCAACLLCVVMACEGGKKEVPLSPSKGLPGELLLIVDASLWNTTSRDSLEGVLKGNVPGLPQQEPMFRMMRIFPKHFTAQYSTMRNIIEVRENPQQDGVKMGVAYNVRAVPQTYVSIMAHDATALNRFLSEHGDEITDLFLQTELKWEASRLKKKHSKTVNDASRAMFGRSVLVPSEIIKVKKGEDFLWASTDRETEDMNYACYSLPLSDTTAIGTDRWIELRDSAMGANIPGALPGSRMSTSREDGMPFAMQRAVKLADGRTAYETRGLWEMTQGALGGPFVSLAFVDPRHGRILVAEGFVYSPGTNKRDLMRRMEAALRTLSVERETK